MSKTSNRILNHQKRFSQVNIGGRSFRIKKDFVEDLESKNLPDLISDMRKAFLFLHSPQDQIVDISNAAELYQNAFHPKSFVSLDGADHLLSDENESKYVGELISTWSKKYLPEEIKENDIKVRGKSQTFCESYTSEIKTHTITY